MPDRPPNILWYCAVQQRAGLNYFIAVVLPDEETVRLLAEPVLPVVAAT